MDMLTEYNIVSAVRDPDTFLLRNWHHSVLWAAVYLMFVHAGPIFMRNRPALNLKRPLALWNAMFTMFSLMTTYKVAPELFDTLRSWGFVSSFCKRGHFFEGERSYWVALFYYSKLFELGDTVFIVLRKRPVVYLHYIHHFIVLLWCWCTYPLYMASARWGVFMNAVVHSAMYAYFFLVSLGARLPGFVKPFITGMQIVQFIIGSLICAIIFYMLTTAQPCDATKLAGAIQLAIYVYLLTLFSRFFHQNYVLKRQKLA
ncbi:putative fatty acid elongation protein 3 [Trichinella nativa]|uniref:Elongation of very long chain fatty acids protein n=4 Tax=Trichinella TaxID=6333 RepID=A0A0V1LCZ7_9BILA|nr:putative fatty acid elongation protein 3 [Trichinella murrelli]KRY09722.1 putative fatty acid elongation protein 3 [Trichinella patagoniensis]KRY57003.1 putative fatty acid elongation protein 3 [Trichinella britovi]KRZ57180.1 putative fatty acid elongation protein 3 [Trichinella nativa]OUC44336.1 GNS1/SUR4 family protein [Trichinella nativa]